VRFPEAKIKKAILSPNKHQRAVAMDYFANSFSADPSVMPVVIQAVETYGKENTRYLIRLSKTIAQTQETVAWVLRELNDPVNERNTDLINGLNAILLQINSDLLMGHQQAVLNALHLSPKQRDRFRNRFEMLSWDEPTCWQALRAACEDAIKRHHLYLLEVWEGTDVVQVLARFGDRCREQVEGILTAPTPEG